MKEKRNVPIAVRFAKTLNRWIEILGMGRSEVWWRRKITIATENPQTMMFRNRVFFLLHSHYSNSFLYITFIFNI